MIIIWQMALARISDTFAGVWRSGPLRGKNIYAWQTLKCAVCGVKLHTDLILLLNRIGTASSEQCVCACLGYWGTYSISTSIRILFRIIIQSCDMLAPRFVFTKRLTTHALYTCRTSSRMCTHMLCLCRGFEHFYVSICARAAIVWPSSFVSFAVIIDFVQL